MKNLTAIAIVFACILALTGCGSHSTEENENGQNYFNATVLEVYDDYILVECLDVTNGIVTSGEKAKVNTEVVSNDEVPELETGDNVRIVFGATDDSIPLQVGNVFSIHLLDEEGNIIDSD